MSATFEHRFFFVLFVLVKTERSVKVSSDETWKRVSLHQPKYIELSFVEDGRLQKTFLLFISVGHLFVIVIVIEGLHFELRNKTDKNVPTENKKKATRK